MTPKVQCATKGLIVKDGRFLVIKQEHEGKVYVDLPGGRMKHGLSPKENLLREIKEEVSLDVEIEKIIGTWYFFRTDKDQVVCITYLCTPLDDKVDLTKNPDVDEEITEYQWVIPEEFLKMESYGYKGLETLKNLVKKHFGM